MRNRLGMLLRLLTGVLILRVVISVVSNYPGYLPPDFTTEFLHGRQGYFFGGYSWAFYTHIVTGPFVLLAGLALMNDRLRRRFPAWHRLLGRIQVVSAVLLLAPSGLWMAFYAATGVVAATGFATLAIATGATAILGWRSAVTRRFDQHRLWMMRCYLLMCSAVVLRLTAGLATVADLDSDWLYPFSAWASWLLPLSVYELFRRNGRRTESR